MTEQREYLYKLHPTRPEMLSEGPTEAEAAILSGHFTYLRDLADRGVVFLAGRTQNTDERAFGLVIFYANSDEAAREIVGGDPAVQHGLMRAELYPYKIAVMGTRP